MEGNKENIKKLSLFILFFSIFSLNNPVVSSTSSENNEKSEKNEELRHHATLGVLLDLHEAVGEVVDSLKNTKIHCGSLNIRSYQQLQAIQWAISTINNNSFSNEYIIDVEVGDSCGDKNKAELETEKLLRFSEGTGDESPLIGVLLMGSRESEKPFEILKKENISGILTSSRLSSHLLLSSHSNIFTTSLHLNSLFQPIMSVVSHVESSSSGSLAVISTCSDSLQIFSKFSTFKNSVYHFLNSTTFLIDSINKFMSTKARGVSTVVLLLDEVDVERLLVESLKNKNGFKKLIELGSKKEWILGTIGINFNLVKEWTRKFKNNLLLVQPHFPPNPQFTNYFIQNLNNPIGKEYVEKAHNCEWGNESNLKYEKIKLCSKLTKTDIRKKFTLDPDINFIVSGVSAYSAALRLAQLESDACSNSSSSCGNNDTLLSQHVLNALNTLNLPPQISDGGVVGEGDENGTVSGSHEIEGTRGRINHDGKLISRKYDIYLSKPSHPIHQVGSYSSTSGLLLTTSSPSSLFSKTPPPPHSSMSLPELYMSRNWAIVAVAISITGSLLTLYILIYVLLRLCQRTLLGNQLLGLLLLLLLISLYSSVLLFILPPSSLLCRMRTVGPGVILAAIYGLLLLKLMQMRSGVHLGLGGRVSQVNLYLTLLFIVGVQLAISLQWNLTNHHNSPSSLDKETSSPYANAHSSSYSMKSNSPPGAPLFNSPSSKVGDSYNPAGAPLFNAPYTTNYDKNNNNPAEAPLFIVPEDSFRANSTYNTKEMSYVRRTFEEYNRGCVESSGELVLLHSYILLLVLILLLYSLSMWHIRRNYNEARWVLLTSLLSLLILIGWGASGLVGGQWGGDGAHALALLSLSTIVLFTVFVPKLGAMGKEEERMRRGRSVLSSPSSISTIFTTASERGTLSLPRKGGRPNLYHIPTTPIGSVDRAPRPTHIYNRNAYP